MKKITLALSAAIIGLTFASCKKYGCTDPEALNFEEKVRSNNLTCAYEGSILFWYDQITQDSLQQLYGQIRALEYYVNDVRIDSLELNNPQDKIPRCGASEIATYSDSLGTTTDGSGTGAARWIEYHVQMITPGGMVGPILYDSIVPITANECLKIQLH